MTSADSAPAPDVDQAIPLEDDETVEWLGRPRTTVILPSAAVGLLLAGIGLLGAIARGDVFPLALVPVGLALPIGHYVVVASIQYAVTDRAIYAKRGVLGRSVTQANLETVQNSAYSQGITGAVFGYGSVEFEIAGGGDLAFRDVRDPKPVRALVDRASRRGAGLTGERARLSRVPGSIEQWQAVRTELQAIRRAFEG